MAIDITYVTRDEADPQLLDTMRLCGRLAVVRGGLRTRVNDLTKTVDERRQILADLRAQEADILGQIDQATARLSPEDAAWMQEQKGLL